MHTLCSNIAQCLLSDIAEISSGLRRIHWLSQISLSLLHLTACSIDINSAILLAVVSPVLCSLSTPDMRYTKHFIIKTARPQLDSIHHHGTFPSVTSGSEESAAHPDLSLHN